MKLACTVLLLVAATSMTACESLGGGLDIVNETDQLLYYKVEPIPPDGGRWQYPINDCSDRDINVTAEDGTVFAELTEKWCPGQVWTIRGKDDGVLEDG